jgi:hypothetical protein
MRVRKRIEFETLEEDMVGLVVEERKIGSPRFQCGV